MTASTAWILLIASVLLLLLVLYIIVSRQEDRRRKAAAPSEPESRPAVAAPPSAPPEPIKPIIPQHTLYRFPYATTTRICPDCDGENDEKYRFCWICGCKMQ